MADNNSKKDKFSAAARNELGGGKSLMGEFVSGIGRDKAEKEKKDLPQQNKTPKDEPVESRLKKIDPQQLQASEFRDFDEPPHWHKPVIWSVAILCFGLLLYFFIFGLKTQPIIYLSNSEIKESSMKSLPTANLAFAKGKELFIFFNAGSRFGIDKVTIKITEIYQDSAGMTKEEVIGQEDASVKPNWKKFYTLFQQDYFDHPGTFKIYAISPGGQAIAVQDFRIK